MKIGYNILKFYIRTGLFFYYTRIEVVGRENIPKDKPVILLANHQNALMDALMIVMNVGVAPYFLARSDLFKNRQISRFLNYLQMIPIYRFRDGRDTLKNNPAIFRKCGDLLAERKTIMLFPEGNHGIQRRVRWPMRKGFVQMIFSALEKNPDMDIRVVPIGMNYRKAQGFPDSVAMHIGKDFAVQDFHDPENLAATESLLKDEVYCRLKQLTTHIPEEEDYDNVMAHLKHQNVDYLNPIAVNKAIQEIDTSVLKPPIQEQTHGFLVLMKWVYAVINFPILLVWNKFVKRMDLDIEFRSTLRFAVGLILFPLYYLMVFLVFAYFLGPWALLVFLAHLLFNVLYVKLG
ncbi:MAG: lysophospholipid acyltransferase family protein [Maribacter sp.]|uniref:lysophospholipid acyltransferase family protein n=1 Tax=Maribacter sp. TaxID=1897614 RepID=UPI003C75F4CB